MASDVHQWSVQVSGAPLCEDHTTQVECVQAGCYWYNNSCHSDPLPPPPPDTMMYILLAAGIIGIAAGGYILLKRRK